MARFPVRSVLSLALLPLALGALLGACASASGAGAPAMATPNPTTAAPATAAATNAPAPSGENAGLPAWFVEREAKLAAAGKPDLAEVPKAAPGEAAALSAQLDRVETELKAAQADLTRDPRAQPAPAPAKSSAFDQEARDALDKTRR